jgi:hypothetical protein
MLFLLLQLTVAVQMHLVSDCSGSEYFAQGDLQESTDCIAEIASSQRSEYCTRMVVRAIDLSLWEREKQQRMVTTLFAHLRDTIGKQQQPPSRGFKLSSTSVEAASLSSVAPPEVLHALQEFSTQVLWSLGSTRLPIALMTSPAIYPRHRRYWPGMPRTQQPSTLLFFFSSGGDEAAAAS